MPAPRKPDRTPLHYALHLELANVLDSVVSALNDAAVGETVTLAETEHLNQALDRIRLGEIDAETAAELARRLRVHPVTVCVEGPDDDGDDEAAIELGDQAQALRQAFDLDDKADMDAIVKAADEAAQWRTEFALAMGLDGEAKPEAILELAETRRGANNLRADLRERLGMDATADDGAIVLALADLEAAVVEIEVQRDELAGRVADLEIACHRCASNR